MSSEYWADRQAKAQNKLTDMGIAATEKQLKKYYSHTMNVILDLFDFANYGR